MQTSEYGVSGLSTAPSPIVAVPPGALLEADNCVIRRPGMIEPRPGFGAESGQLADGLTAIYKLLPYNDSYLRVGTTGAVIKSVWKDGTPVAALQDLWSPHHIRGVEARKNLYLTTTDATRKFTAALDTTAAKAGLQAPLGMLLAAAGGTGIGNNETRAYRFTISRTDVNNVVVTSPPSSRGLFTASGGATGVTVTATFGTNAGFAAGDVVKLYGSESLTGTPSDELFYIASATLGASDITNGYVQFTDHTANADLGEALYTNATQQGIVRANNAPPLAKDLALFGGSLFAGNITWPHALAIRWTYAGSASLAGSATGIGSRTLNGIRTNGSAVITAIASTAGVKVGQMLVTNLASWSGTSPVLVTAVGANSVTMSSTWGGATDGAGVDHDLVDTIRIKTGSEDRYYLSGTAIDFGVSVGTGSAALRVVKSSNTTVYFYGDSIDANASGYQSGPIFANIQQLLPSTASFQVWATHGSEYDPPLPEPTVASGQASTQDAFINGLTWSKQDEPEHFVRRNLWLVGNARAPIVRIVALEDGLLVFKGKGDGIYLLTGYGELSGWSVRQIDPTTYLLHPELVTTLEDAAYGWTNTGMCRIDTAGQTMLSGPITNLTDDIEKALNPNSATMSFANATANLPDHELIFSLPTSTSSLAAPAVTYVYNTLTNAWTQWFGVDGAAPNAMAFDPSTNGLMFGPAASGIARVMRSSTATYQIVDLTYSATVSAVSGGVSVTINGGSGWTPEVGDFVLQGGTAVVVTAVANSTHFTVSAAITTGAITAGKAFRQRISWVPKVEPSGAQIKRYQSFVTHWDDVEGLYSWSMGFTGPRGNTATLSYTRTRSPTGTQVRADTRALLPASVAMDSQIYPTLTITNGDARWRVTGISENFDVATDRVSR